MAAEGLQLQDVAAAAEAAWLAAGAAGRKSRSTPASHARSGDFSATGTSASACMCVQWHGRQRPARCNNNNTSSSHCALRQQPAGSSLAATVAPSACWTGSSEPPQHSQYAEFQDSNRPTKPGIFTVRVSRCTSWAIMLCACSTSQQLLRYEPLHATVHFDHAFFAVICTLTACCCHTAAAGCAQSLACLRCSCGSAAWCAPLLRSLGGCCCPSQGGLAAMAGSEQPTPGGAAAGEGLGLWSVAGL
jgi:hypothetical protein